MTQEKNKQKNKNKKEEEGKQKKRTEMILEFLRENYDLFWDNFETNQLNYWAR